MILYTGKPLKVPGAKCPECGAGIRCYIDQWDQAEDGTWLPVPTPECVRNDDGHRYWQSDWQEVRDHTERWAQAHVRDGAATS